MLILDTDHLTIIQRQSEPAFSRISTKFRETPGNTIFTTIISFEEQMRGWLAVINRLQKTQEEIKAYRQLHRLLAFFSEIPVLDFDEAAAERVTHLRDLGVRIGTMDLKIAAIALSRKAILLSCNLADFRKVPELQLADWS